MEQRMFLDMRMTQKMVMTPRMQQAIKMLQMPTLELEALVEQELMENPVLEEVPTEDLQNAGSVEAEERPNPADGNGKTEGDKLAEGKIELSEDWERFFEDGSDSSYMSIASGFSAPLDEEFDRVIPDEVTLRDELERQLDIAVTNETEREIGSALLNSLDGDGYLAVPIEEIADQTGHPLEMVERVLGFVHTFDPPGIGARDLSECLEIQYHAAGMGEPLLLELIRHHIKDLEHRRFQVIAKALRITQQEVQRLADDLAKFEPRPGRRLVSYENEYITPDVFVEKVGGEWQIRLHDDGIAPLRVSPKYRQMLENKDSLDRETLKYIRTRLHSAVDLIKNIEQRKQTLYRVTQEIVNQQEEFLEDGVKYLKPMRLRDVADVVGVHETTVCRVVNGKYVETPQGLFELKYFFSGGLESDNGEDASAKSVMAMVQELIDNEDPKKPLSDQKVSDMLKAKGINIARRTVAKYRDILGILPTSMRKRV
jgi:RNA polymerase sigma-54 factor